MEALAVNNQVFLASSIKCVKTGKCVYGNCSEEQDRGKLSNNLTTVREAKELMGALEDCMNEIEVLSHSQSGPGAYRGGRLGPISPHPRNDVLALLLLCFNCRVYKPEIYYYNGFCLCVRSDSLVGLAQSLGSGARWFGCACHRAEILDTDQRYPWPISGIVLEIMAGLPAMERAY